MKIMTAALVALGIVALPATYAEARDYHHHWRHHGPVVIVGPRHHWHPHHREYWGHRGPYHHRWYGHRSQPHFSHN